MLQIAETVNLLDDVPFVPASDVRNLKGVKATTEEFEGVHADRLSCIRLSCE